MSFLPTLQGLVDIHMVDDYLAAMFSTGLDKLSFDELLYLDSNLPANDSVKQALNLQKNKSFAKVKGAIDTYCNLEAEFIDKLIFILEYRSWQYLIARHKQVVNYYSQVGIVSDYVYDIVEQYNGIVRSCFSSGDLNRQLQKEVTAYSTAINNARARYTALANLTGDYPKFNIKLPSIGNFPIKSNMEIAGRIPAAREDFVSSRQTADAVSSIASWFVGGLASAIGKGLFDIYAVDELAESEYKARYAYIEDVYNQLEAIFLNYFNQLEKSTRSQMLDNQKIFKSYVNKQ